MDLLAAELARPLEQNRSLRRLSRSYVCHPSPAGAAGLLLRARADYIKSAKNELTVR